VKGTGWSRPGERSGFVFKLINKILDYLVAAFFEGAAYPEEA
jgi:hypothetical protein